MNTGRVTFGLRAAKCGRRILRGPLTGLRQTMMHEVQVFAIREGC